MTNWRTSGVVDEIDREAGTITVWLRDFEKLQTVPIHASMPEWMIVVDACFNTEITREAAGWMDLPSTFVDWKAPFTVAEFSDLSDSELDEEFYRMIDGQPPMYEWCAVCEKSMIDGERCQHLTAAKESYVSSAPH